MNEMNYSQYNSLIMTEDDKQTNTDVYISIILLFNLMLILIHYYFTIII